MSGACIGQHMGDIVNNGQQFAVLHASVMPFLGKVLLIVLKSFSCVDTLRFLFPNIHLL